jgi:hypothetical protein
MESVTNAEETPYLSKYKIERKWKQIEEWLYWKRKLMRREN